ncbi:MAG: hypothetical protein CM15mP8_1420 [Methanobacteriota archaeon]|nr:MAG: hypothetical protein CM15mP8_1420 [Euryarchaeota archaeon]
MLAKTDPDAGYRGMSGFIVENDAEGFSLGKKRQIWGRGVQIQGQLFLTMLE